MSSYVKTVLIYSFLMSFPLLAQVPEIPDPGSGCQPVPKKLQNQAKKTFSEGKTYFIWSEQEVPVKASGHGIFNFVPFPLKYSANPKIKPLQFAIEVVATMNSDGKIKDHYYGSDGYSTFTTGERKGKGEWKAVGMMMLYSEIIEGKGKVKIYLVRREDFKKSKDDKTQPPPEPISNTVTLPIIFE